MARTPADAARNRSEQHLVPGTRINNVYWCLNQAGWSQPGFVTSKAQFLAYSSWYQDMNPDCEIDTDLRRVDRELLLRHFGRASEHEIPHWVAKAEEAESQDRK